MTSSPAWLIECDDSLTIAVGEHEMTEYIQEQECYPVPGSPEHCSRVLVWQDNIVPVMDIGTLNGGAGEQVKPFLCVLAYQQEPMAPLQHLALRVSSPPQRIQVEDEQACEFPDELISSVLRPVALSCFLHEQQPVIVVDIARLCSAEFRDLATAA